MDRAKNVPMEDIRKYVQDKTEFISVTGAIFSRIYSNMSGSTKRYVVFVLGVMSPMFVYDFGTKRWFENNSKYSEKTFQHRWRNAAHPLPPEGTTEIPIYEMRVLADYGLESLVKWKMGVKP